jgi:PiT family inorganic phosphate transporter
MVVGLALLFDFSNGFHDAANVVATIITTGALSPRKALMMAAICEFLGPFIFGTLFLKGTLYLSRNATPRINYFFNRMQIPSSIALSLSHGANDAQKSMGLITMSLVILGISPTFHIPFWVIASCAAAIALGTASGGWRIIKTIGSKIYRLRSVHAFCAQTASATVILGAALFGGPVSTTHVVSSSIMGVGAGQRISAVRWGVAKNIIVAWFITIPATALMAGASFFLIRMIHPSF